jgi:hypothetical protein
MLNNDLSKSIRYKVLAENTADKRGNPLSLNSIATFVSFVVRNSG